MLRGAENAKIRMGGKTMDIKNKIDDLRSSVAERIYRVAIWLAEKRCYVSYANEDEQTLEYLTWLTTMTKLFRIPAETLKETDLIDESWICYLLRKLEFGGLTDKQRKTNDKKLRKLELLSPTVEQLRNLTLADDLILVVGLLEEVRAAREAWATKLVHCVFEPGNNEHNRMLREFWCVGKCEESRRFEVARNSYREVLNEIDRVYRKTERELERIRKWFERIFFFARRRRVNEKLTNVGSSHRCRILEKPGCTERETGAHFLKVGYFML